MPVNRKVTPGCCETVAKHKTVFLDYEMADLQDGTFRTKKPEFVAVAFDEERNENYNALVDCCPHCKAAIPDVRKRRTKEPICDPDLENNVCHTCNEPLPTCRCMPPEYAYEPYRHHDGHDGHQPPHNRIRHR